MARKSYRDALYDQPLECRLIPFTGDKVRDRTEDARQHGPGYIFPSATRKRTCKRTPPTSTSDLQVVRRRRRCRPHRDRNLEQLATELSEGGGQL